MSAKLLILLAAAAAIAGCSSKAPPPPVTRAPGATSLYIPALAEQWTGGVVQLATKDKYGCGRFAPNVLPDPVDDDYIVEIEGNKDIFFHIARADAQTGCNIYGMFYATRGNDYLVKFEIINNQCKFALTEKSPAGIQNKINTYPAHVSNVDGIKVCENKSRLY